MAPLEHLNACLYTSIEAQCFQGKSALLQKFAELFDGWHAALYVSDFSGASRAMEAADLIFTEHNFFDANIDGLRDTQKFHQFRFQASATPCLPGCGCGLLSSGARAPDGCCQQKYSCSKISRSACTW